MTHPNDEFSPRLLAAMHARRDARNTGQTKRPSRAARSAKLDREREDRAAKMRLRQAEIREALELWRASGGRPLLKRLQRELTTIRREMRQDPEPIAPKKDRPVREPVATPAIAVCACEGCGWAMVPDGRARVCVMCRRP